MDVSIHFFVHFLLGYYFYYRLFFSSSLICTCFLYDNLCIVYLLATVYCFFIFSIIYLFIYLSIVVIFFSFILFIYLFLNSTNDFRFYFYAKLTTIIIIRFYFFCTTLDIPYLISVLLFIYKSTYTSFRILFPIFKYNLKFSHLHSNLLSYAFFPLC